MTTWALDQRSEQGAADQLPATGCPARVESLMPIQPINLEIGVRSQAACGSTLTLEKWELISTRLSSTVIGADHQIGSGGPSMPARLFLPRHYHLFAALAGVVKPHDGFKELIPARGLPN